MDPANWAILNDGTTKTFICDISGWVYSELSNAYRINQDIWRTWVISENVNFLMSLQKSKLLDG